MSRKRYWIGSLGPYFYDDDDPVNDPQGVVTQDQAGIVSEGSITALEGLNDPTGILRLKAQAEPTDPSKGYGYFWLDQNYNLYFKLKDSNGNIRQKKIFKLDLELSENSVSSETTITNLSLSVV